MATITQAQTSAHFPIVEKDGVAVPVTDILGDSLLASTGIADQVTFERQAVGIVNISDVNNAWFSTTGTDIQKIGIYIPTLAELGYPTGYELQAAIGVNAHDSTNNAPGIEVRLLDYPSLTPVAGFSLSGTLSGNSADQAFKSGFSPLTGGQSYLVDFRSELGKTARVRVYSIFLRIIKT